MKNEEIINNIILLSTLVWGKYLPFSILACRNSNNNHNKPNNDANNDANNDDNKVQLQKTDTIVLHN